MKAAAILLIVLVLAAVGAVGYLYLKADLTVQFENCIATEAVSQTEYFQQLKKQLANGTFVGTRFSDKAPGSAEEYQFLTYTVKLTNHAFLDADVIELRVMPMKDDVLQIGDSERRTLPKGRETQVSATILASREMHSVREGTVTFYFWGIPFTTRLTLGK